MLEPFWPSESFWPFCKLLCCYVLLNYVEIKVSEIVHGLHNFLHIILVHWTSCRTTQSLTRVFFSRQSEVTEFRFKIDQTGLALVVYCSSESSPKGLYPNISNIYIYIYKHLLRDAMTMNSYNSLKSISCIELHRGCFPSFSRPGNRFVCSWSIISMRLGQNDPKCMKMPGCLGHFRTSWRPSKQTSSHNKLNRSKSYVAYRSV